MTHRVHHSAPLARPWVAALLLGSLGAASAQTWTPVGGRQARSVEFTRNASFELPASLAARGGVLRALLVGGGEGGSLPRSSCDDTAVQGGKGGDGGEVVEVDILLQPGMCAAGLAVQVGSGGRGALRSGNASVQGEMGGTTTVSCAGALVAQALGGGRRADAVTAPRAARGGAGAVVMNVAEAATNASFDQRHLLVRPGGDGQPGRQGLGAGGGGGGVALASAGFVSAADGSTERRTTLRHAPPGRGGAAGGTGAGPTGYAPHAPAAVAENAAHHGAGGGGGAAWCGGGAPGPRDAGHGFGGMVRFQWAE